MALTGTLKDFGIAEILQLIGTQKKTGVLTLEDNKHRAVIEFADGMIVNASGGTVGLTLEARLEKAEYLTQAQIAEATKKARETLKPFSTVLVAENMIGAPELRGIITQHVAEIVYETFAWKTGTYAFEQKFIQWDKQFISPMSAESIMMDGLRIVDESPGVFKIIPSFDDVYAHTGRDLRSRDISPDMERILGLCNGRCTVMDVILKSRMARFDALKLVAKLVSEELLTKVTVVPKRDVKKSGEPVQLQKPAVYALYALVAVLGLVALFRIGLVIKRVASPISQFGNASSGSLYITAGETRLRNAIETYRVVKGSYPESLDALVEIKLMGKSEIKTFQDNGLDYKVEGGSYKLERTAKHEGGESNP